MEPNEPFSPKAHNPSHTQEWGLGLPYFEGKPVPLRAQKAPKCWAKFPGVLVEGVGFWGWSRELQ